jgi:hypothetical protein
MTEVRQTERGLALLRVIVFAASLAGVAGCFEEPVREELELRFPSAEVVEASATVTLVVPNGEEGHGRLIARLDALERDLLAGATPWARRFAALEPVREGQAWQRAGGRLEWFRQSASADPARLADFFADTPVQVFYQVKGRTAELSLFAGAGTRATAGEVARAAAALAAWSEAVAAYEAAAFRVWGHLEAHPERRRSCVGSLFAFDLEEGAADRLPPLTKEEESLLEPLSEAMERVAAVLKVPPEEPETLEELARRVYDPYPAHLRLMVAGRVLAADGVVRAGDGWEVPSRSPWSAFAAVSASWLAPDPMLARIEQARRVTKGPFDLDAFLARQFTHGDQAPDAEAVREAITGALAAGGTVRLVWELEGTPVSRH